MSLKDYLDNLNAPYLFYRQGEFISSDDNYSMEMTFPGYSLIKPMIASLIMRAIDQKHLKLTDRIGSYLNLNEKWLQNLTIEDLLFHRSGLKDYGYHKDYKDRLIREDSSSGISSDLLKEIVIKQGQGKYGEFFYSNIGYLYLNEILQKVYSKTFPQIFDAEFKAVLGLKHSNILEGKIDSQTYSFTGLVSDQLGQRSLAVGYHSSFVSHGFLITSVFDLQLFFKRVFTPGYLTEDSIKTLRSLKSLDFPSKVISANYGAGFMGDMNSSIGSFIGHDGGGPSFSIGGYEHQNSDIIILVIGKENERCIDLIAQDIAGELS